ncbi:hypothetical protein FRAHR75_320081 [Frankia sp. Hr75.2]|nr:hypothetical protein FRAHR75_320081 [Frankia sp. Hr75.2]
MALESHCTSEPVPDVALRDSQHRLANIDRDVLAQPVGLEEMGQQLLDRQRVTGADVDNIDPLVPGEEPVYVTDVGIEQGDGLGYHIRRRVAVLAPRVLVPEGRAFVEVIVLAGNLPIFFDAINEVDNLGVAEQLVKLRPRGGDLQASLVDELPPLLDDAPHNEQVLRRLRYVVVGAIPHELKTEPSLAGLFNPIGDRPPTDAELASELRVTVVIHIAFSPKRRITVDRFPLQRLS